MHIEIVVALEKSTTRLPGGLSGRPSTPTCARRLGDHQVERFCALAGIVRFMRTTESYFDLAKPESFRSIFSTTTSTETPCNHLRLVLGVEECIYNYERRGAKAAMMTTSDRRPAPPKPLDGASSSPET
jgi:hypothetical protein